MDINQLKARAYDLISLKEQAESELRNVNQAIVKLSQEAQKNAQTKEPKEETKKTAKK